MAWEVSKVKITVFTRAIQIQAITHPLRFSHPFSEIFVELYFQLTVNFAISLHLFIHPNVAVYIIRISLASILQHPADSLVVYLYVVFQLIKNLFLPDELILEMFQFCQDFHIRIFLDQFAQPLFKDPQFILEKTELIGP